jgi:hypothetical protein
LLAKWFPDQRTENGIAVLGQVTAAAINLTKRPFSAIVTSISS